MSYVSALRKSQRLLCIGGHLVRRGIINKMSSGSDATAGIIVIGDEILKGQTLDTNSHFLSKHLFSLGVKVQRVSVIPDDLEVIAKEVREFSSKYTYVLTSGGIGPTHDDMTSEGIAMAFGEEVKPHAELVKLVRQFFGDVSMDSPEMKLAHVPESAQLRYGVHPITGKTAPYPLVTVRNVYLFPGIPHLLERNFANVEHLFRNEAVQFHVRQMFLAQDEMSIAGMISKVNKQYKDRVDLGSYPKLDNSYYQVKLTIQGKTTEIVDEVYNHLASLFPPEILLDYDVDPVAHAADKVYALADTFPHARHALDVIEECFDRYSLEEVCLSFNGGKDCTVLLHLMHAVMQRRYPGNRAGMPLLYVRCDLPFPEVEQFIHESADRQQQSEQPASGVEGRYHGHTSQPISRAADHEAFMMTDAGWPQFMRVQPIMDWTYEDIWKFLRQLCVPYCSLYDKGYTSLGSMHNTHPNSQLKYMDQDMVKYRPAYKLKDASQERTNRF
ncbi:PREDICTED: FAD synthase-like [Priapulus caudatus]|uniref:FAD synthase n=1 Tax=Priapulus caudatus TaxID=37621 RepID=A0ABM1EQ69_PRICU|nr:PREDICTED: FAD synthase-like [Priapulus caudatus]